VEVAMSGNQPDETVLQAIDAVAPATIDEVVSLMQQIDGVLQGNDGLKWFNLLYLMVTKEIGNNPPASGWAAPAWVTRLDVVFAGLYFEAVANYLGKRGAIPSSWQALLEARFTPGIDRIQYALAGMNAHINHDLSLALLQTDRELSVTPGLNSPEHGDYQQVNDTLEEVLPQALTVLATGPLGELAQDTGMVGRLLAIWKVRVARDLAWDFADHLRGLSGVARTAALAAQDKLTGALGRSLLLALDRGRL
jgi:hypothetical protein